MGRGGGGGGRGFGGGGRGFGGGHSHGSGFGGGGSHVGHNHGGNWNGGWGGRGGGRRFYNDAWSGPRYYAPAPVYYAPAPVYYPSAPAYDNSWTEVTYDNSCTCNEAHYSDCNSSPCNNLLSDSSTDYTTYETTTTEATTEYVETPADTNTWTISIGRKLRSQQGKWGSRCPRQPCPLSMACGVASIPMRYRPCNCPLPNTVCLTLSLLGTHTHANADWLSTSGT
jgi:hypothetical protein